MDELKKLIYDENNGLYYTLVGDYYILDLKLSGDEAIGMICCPVNLTLTPDAWKFDTLTVAGFPLIVPLLKTKWQTIY